MSQITDEMACEFMIDTAAVLDSQRNLGLFLELFDLNDDYDLMVVIK